MAKKSKASANPMFTQAVAPRSPADRAKWTLLEILGVVLFVLFMMPFLVVLLNSSKTYNEIMLSAVSLPGDMTNLWLNIKAVFTDTTTDYLAAFVDSVIVTSSSLAVLVLCSSMCAWVLVRRKSKITSFMFLVFVAAMVIPFQVVMYPMVYFLKAIGNVLHITLTGTYYGIAFAYLGFGCSLSIFVFHGFIKAVPMALEEAATIDGCSQPGTFFKIVFPLLSPVCVTVAILNGIWIWNDYLLPLLVLGSSGKVQTIPLAVTAFAGAYVKQWNLIMTSALLAMVPIVVLFLFAQKYIIKGMVEGAVK